MSMFRNPLQVGLSPEHFGAGQILFGDYKYLVVGGIGAECIILINLQSMQQLQGFVSVENINQLSQEEARKVCDLTKLNWAFSDFDFDARGIK